MNKKIDISLFRNLDIWKIEADQDLFLNDYYVEISAYKELFNTSKYVVAWRKWTGKSALKQVFNSRKKSYNNLIADFQFSKIFNASFFDDLSINYEDQQKSYIDLIKYVLLVRLMILMISDESIDSAFRKEINNFLLINWYKIENISSLYTTVKNDSTIKVSWEIGFWLDIWIFSAKWSAWRSDSKTKNIQEVDYRQVLDNLTKLILEKLNNKNNYVILIDKIDDLWTTYFAIYDNVALNFIKAVNDFNRDFREYLWKDNLSRIIIFLREDLLYRLRWKDANFNKIMQDDLIRLDWKIWYWEHNSLLNDLINKRLEKALELKWFNPDEYEKPFIFNALDNSSIIKIMKETQFRWKDEKSTFYKRVLYNRTYLRPRDIVKYFHFLTLYDENPNDFQAMYSDYLWEEIDNELNPILFDVERTKRTLKKICTWWSGKFPTEEFIKIYKSWKYRWMKHDDDLELTANETLEKLYDYSVIWNFSTRIKKVKNRNTGEYIGIEKSDYRFKYRENNKIDFDSEKECIIHAWLYQALWIQFDD